MIIYGNNLHEKLQGVAISRDYLKYNTPFCDLVDDPDWQLDIDLAVNYNKGSYGNLAAADKFVQDLTINSGILDYSTIEYYTHKIKHNPAFKSAIDNMRNRWSDPNLFDDDFQFDFNQALKDCLNSPCNLFLETSDSIGRIAQSASTKTTANTFGVGELSASFVNMINGLDETITNKLPGVFKNAFIEVTAVASKAWENTQAVMAGKENLSAFYDDINNGKSLRDPAKSFRYTPDVQSYYDSSASSSNVLAAIKRELGGCFGRFQNKFRYNPYDNNQNTKSPLGTKSGNVNGVTTDENPTGETKKYTNPESNSKKVTDQTGVTMNAIDIDIDNFGDIEVTYAITLNSKGKNKYSVFAAYIDKDNTTMYIDPYEATTNDKITRAGQGNIGPQFLFAKSAPLMKSNVGKQILNGNQPKDITSETGSIAGDIGAGWEHNITDVGMETLYPKEDKIYNDGVAVSAGLLATYFNDNIQSFNTKQRTKYIIDTGIHSYQRANQAFVAVRLVGKEDWQLYKIIDVNFQIINNVDFTVGAWKHLLDTNGFSLDDSKAEPIPNIKKWKKVVKEDHSELNHNNLEIKLCRGDIEEIKAELERANKEVEELAELRAGVARDNEVVEDIDGWPFDEEGNYDESKVTGQGTNPNDPRFVDD